MENNLKLDLRKLQNKYYYLLKKDKENKEVQKLKAEIKTLTKYIKKKKQKDKIKLKHCKDIKCEICLQDCKDKSKVINPDEVWVCDMCYNNLMKFSAAKQKEKKVNPLWN